ncbi:MAG: malonate--CoA ligase [Alphaproteobacteria bacterium]
MGQDLFSALSAASPAPEKVVLTTPEGRRLTYDDLFAMARRFAHLLALRGVGPGDRVAVQVEKSPEALALILGVAAAGAVVLPLNTAYTKGEVDFFVGDATPRVLVATPARASELGAVATRHSSRLETLGTESDGSLAGALAGADAAFKPVRRAGSDLAAILYTSGTTGRAKGAMLSHDNLVANARTLVEVWRFSEHDVLIHALPIFHTHGLFVATNTLLLAGGSMLFLERFDAETVVRLMPQATAMMGVPTYYTRLLAHPDFDRALSASMRLFISGSAPLSAEVHKAFFARTGHAILERYGMSETGMNTSNPYAGERRPGTVGLPLPDVQLRITEPETGAVRPPGEVGVIEVKGPNVFAGYWGLEEQTEEAFRADGWFVTGDLARIDDDGYVHIVGRDKDLIISGGFNVYPAEVEAHLDALAGVAESAVIGVPHPDLGEGVTAVVALEPGAKLSENEVRQALAGELAGFKQPKRVFFVPTLPRNAMGKIQKVSLRETYRDTYASGG